MLELIGQKRKDVFDNFHRPPVAYHTILLGFAHPPFVPIGNCLQSGHNSCRQIRIKQSYRGMLDYLSAIRFPTRFAHGICATYPSAFRVVHIILGPLVGIIGHDCMTVVLINDLMEKVNHKCHDAAVGYLLSFTFRGCSLLAPPPLWQSIFGE